MAMAGRRGYDLKVVRSGHLISLKLAVTQRVRYLYCSSSQINTSYLILGQDLIHQLILAIATLLTMPGQVNGSANGAANGAHPKDTLPKELVDEMQRLFDKHTGYRTSMISPKLKSNIANLLKLTPKVSS